MIFHQFCVLTIFFEVFVNIQFITCCCYKPTPENFEDAEELKIAWQLDTGYVRSTNNLPSRMDINEFKRMMTYNINKPESFTLHNRPQIIYYKLYCSNLRDLLQYIYLIDSPETFELLIKNNSLILDESIIQHMLALMLKSELDAALDPLWAMFMFAIYIRVQRDYTNTKLDEHFMNLIQIMIAILKSHAMRDCDLKNPNTINTYSNDTYKIEEIKYVMNVMNNRKQNNSSFLSDIEVENWISLGKIYLNEVIQNGDILKTIIMHYGEQSQEIYNDIIEDINTAYKDARNYYWFDLWISKIGHYQKKVFDIFRIVALYFIRKQLSYLLLCKDKSIIKSNYTEMHKLLVNTLNDTFNFKRRNIDHIIHIFSQKPSKSRSYYMITSENIKLIDEHIERNYFVKSFKMIKEDDEDFKKSLDNKMNRNFEELKHFVEYLKCVYENIDIKIVRSFFEYFSIDWYVAPSCDWKKEIEYLKF